MKKIPLAARICFFSTLALSLAATVLRTVAMFVCFDTEVGYFDASFLTTLLTVLTYVAVLLPAVLAILTPKGQLSTQWTEVKRGLTAIIPAVCCAFGGLWVLITYFYRDEDIGLWFLVSLPALASAAYYALRLCRGQGRRVPEALFNILCFAPLLWGLLAIAETYMDQFTTMNSPIKLSLQLAFLSALLAIISSLRFHFQKALPRCAMLFNAAACFFCLSASIPVLVALAAGILTNILHGAYAVVLLGIGIYTLLHFIAYFRASTDEAPENSESSSVADSL